AGQLALAERGRGLLQLHPGTPGGPAVELLPNHRSAHPVVRVELLVDIAVMSRYPRGTGLREPPLLVQFRVDDDRRSLRAELRGGRLQPPAVAPGPGGDVDQQPNPGTHPRGPLRAERRWARTARGNHHGTKKY